MIKIGIKTTLILLLVLTNVVNLLAQAKLTYISSESAINKGITAHDKGIYKSAIKYFSKVHKGDTNYLRAQYEMSNTYFTMEKYQQCIDVSTKANSELNQYSNEFYNVIGSSYDELGNREQAIFIYTKAIKEFPTFYRSYFNRAVTYERMDKMDSAILDYQQTLRLNPYHSTTHYKLGELAKNEGEIAKALICYNSYLLMEPGNNVEFLAELNEMAQGEFEEDPKNITLSSDDYAYLNELILSKSALKNSYKTPNKLELAYVKQNYLLFEELQKRELGEGFWDSFYAPFFIEILKSGKFNDLMYYSLQSSTNVGIVKVLEKNIKAINTFPDWAGDLWQTSHSTFVKEIDGVKKECTYSWLDGNTVESWSVLEDGVSVGYAKYYHYNGKLNASGYFNERSEQNNHWDYYYNTGQKSGSEDYENGKIVGSDTAFWKNGLVQMIDSYENGVTTGLSVSYLETGAPETKMNYENDNPQGEAFYYNEIGGLNYKVNYKEGLFSGEFIEYYTNQQIAEVVDFDNDTRNGLSKEFYNDGSKKAETNYKEGVGHGKYKSWYPNGVSFEEGEYKEGVLVGKYTTYNPNGTIASVSNYDESGHENGTYQEFDKSGKLNVELTYKKGEMVGYKVFHRDGSLIKESKKSNKEFLFENFYSDGTRRTTGIYQPNDIGKNGIWKFYDKNGVLESEEHYVNGELNGKSISYYPTGKKSEAANYIDGSMDGYFVDYYTNGAMSSQGYFVNNLQEGLWKSYQVNGAVSAEYFYVQGLMNGPQAHYNVDGSLDLIEYYKNDMLISFELFDTIGVVYQADTTRSDSSSYTIQSISGSTLRTFSRKYFIIHGPSISYHGNGKESLKGGFFMGIYHGLWQSFHDNGELENSGEYFYGDKIGSWGTYNNKGVLVMEEKYVTGQLHGLMSGYHDNGKLDYTINYESNFENGSANYYDRNGILQFTREYYYGKIVGYTYLGTNGSPVETISITNETGVVKSFFENGKISREYEMKNGLFVGNYSEFYENGQLMATTDYIDGIINGIRTEYWDNGEVKSEEPYFDNYLNGEVKHYNKNGNLIVTQTYLADVLNGLTRFYNTSGEVIRTVEYFDSVIVSEK